jgi:predicted RNA-binding protein YlxR (DUF448 family)
MPRPPLLKRRLLRRRATTDGQSFEIEPADDDEPETGPLRRCIVTRERLPKERMIRFVLGPDRMVVPDLAARLPGRGMWLSASADVVETARTKGGLARSFARAARGPVTLPVDLAALLQASLVRRIVDLLGLARRAGQAVSGFQKAREWLVAGRAGLVVQASDGSADERSRFLSGIKDGIPVGMPLPGAELGRVFGRDHAVHVVVSPGRLAAALANEIARLSALRGETGPRSEAGAASGLQAAGGNAGTNEAGTSGIDEQAGA